MRQLGRMTELRAVTELTGTTGKLEQVSAVCHNLELFNNVGLSALYKGIGKCTLDFKEVIYAALADVLHKNPILSAIPVDEGIPSSYFAALPSIRLEESVVFIERSQTFDAEDSTDAELDAILESQHNTNFKLHYGKLPFWRLVILQSATDDADFTASLVYHHAIGDGISGLVFHKTLCDSLNAVIRSSPGQLSRLSEFIPSKGTELLPPIEGLHPLPINDNPAESHLCDVKEWAGNPIIAPCISRYKSLYLSPASSTGFILECKTKGLSFTSGLTAVVSATLFPLLPPGVEGLTCTIPVSLRPWIKLPCKDTQGAMGNYFDAFKTQVLRRHMAVPDSRWPDIWSMAANISESIKNHRTNCSPSGEPYTAIAALKTLPDVSLLFTSSIGKDRDAALEVSNLGAFPQPDTAEIDSTWRVGRMTFSRSSVVSGSAVTINVVTGGDGAASIGFSWQDGVVEESVVNGLYGGVAAYFEQYR